MKNHGEVVDTHLNDAYSVIFTPDHTWLLSISHQGMEQEDGMCSSNTFHRSNYQQTIPSNFNFPKVFSQNAVTTALHF